VTTVIGKRIIEAAPLDLEVHEGQDPVNARSVHGERILFFASQQRFQELLVFRGMIEEAARVGQKEPVISLDEIWGQDFNSPGPARKFPLPPLAQELP
jgi:hypothetical protein